VVGEFAAVVAAHAASPAISVGGWVYKNREKLVEGRGRNLDEGLTCVACRCCRGSSRPASRTPWWPPVRATCAGTRTPPPPARPANGNLTSG